MSNVLPQEASRSVWGMYRARGIIAGSLVLLGAALFSAVALLPSYLALQIGTSPTPSDQPLNSSDQVDRSAILQTQSLLAVLSPLVSATTTPSDVIARALAVRPSGVLVDHVTFTSGNPGAIVLYGSASGGDAVNAYRKALNADSDLKSVTVPVGDLAGAADGRFTMTLSGNF